MDGLREHYRHVADVIDETLRHNEEQEEAGQHDRTALTGDTVRKLIRGARRRADPSHPDDSGDELDNNFFGDERDEDGYIDCYAIPMRGRHARETWIKYLNEPKSNDPGSASGGQSGEGAGLARVEEEETYMANLLRNTVFRRVELNEVPAGVKVPPTLCPLYTVDPDQTPVGLRPCDKARPKDNVAPKDTPREEPPSLPVASSSGIKDGTPKITASSEKEPILPDPAKSTPEKAESEQSVGEHDISGSTEDDEGTLGEEAPSEPPPVPPKPGNLPPLSSGPSSILLRGKDDGNASGKKPKPFPKPNTLGTRSPPSSPGIPGKGMVNGHTNGEGEHPEETQEGSDSNTGVMESEYQDDPTVLPPGRPLSIIKEAQSQESVSFTKLKDSVQDCSKIEDTIVEHEYPNVETCNKNNKTLSNGHINEESEVNDIYDLGNEEDHREEKTEEKEKEENEKEEVQCNGHVEVNVEIEDSVSENEQLNNDHNDDYESYETIMGERCIDNINREYKKLEKPSMAGGSGSSSTERPDSGVTDPLSEPSFTTSDGDRHSLISAASKEATPPPEEDKDGGKHKGASVESLSESTSPGGSLHSNMTDSGIDAANATSSTVNGAPVPPARTTSQSSASGGTGSNPGTLRRQGKLPKPPQLLPRISVGSGTDVHIPTSQDDGSSEDDSYYEDIEIVDNSSSLYGRGGMVSYLDPKSYARALEATLSPENRKSMERMVQAEPIMSSSEQDTSRVLLPKDELLIADMEECCPQDGATDGYQNEPEGPEGTPSNAMEEDRPYTKRDFRAMLLTYDKLGRGFYISKVLLKKHGDPEGEPWFYPVGMTSRHATLFLGQEKQEGCFVVYRPKTQDPRVVYNLSVCRSNGDVLHYHIVENAHGDVMVEGHDHSFMNVRDLVTYFRRNKSGLATALRRPLREARQPLTPGYHYDRKWEITRPALSLTGQIIGHGHFGVVCAGVYNKIPVAVKVLQKPDTSIIEEDDFIEEAHRLMELKHDHVVRLVGVSCTARPYFLVTEFVSRGNLRDCLRDGTIPSDNLDTLFDVSIQITSAVAYLEGRQYLVHRDLAARNFLVASDLCVKLADFGRAKFVTDDSYQASRTEKISVKWAAPEVLCESTYSTKSDVWAVGVVFWEVMSAGDRPYANMAPEQVAVFVTEGGRLEKPPGCSPDLFAIIKSCWRHHPEERPTSASLYDTLRSKSSLYYGTIRPRPTSETGPMTKAPPAPETPQRPAPRIASSPATMKKPPTSVPTMGTLPLSLSATRPTTPTSRARKTVSLDSRTEDLVRDAFERSETFTSGFNSTAITGSGLDHGGSRLPTSSSETSLVSAMSQAHGKDDMTRGGKIRKSLRKMITGTRHKKGVKGDLGFSPHDHRTLDRHPNDRLPPTHHSQQIHV